MPTAVTCALLTLTVGLSVGASLGPERVETIKVPAPIATVPGEPVVKYIVVTPEECLRALLAADAYRVTEQDYLNNRDRCRRQALEGIS